MIKAIASIRLVSHHLEIETGRYSNIERNQRICKECAMNCVESEYHFVCVCPAYRSIRNQYINMTWPTVNKFNSLMSSTSKCKLYKLGKYINLAMNLKAGTHEKIYLIIACLLRQIASCVHRLRHDFTSWKTSSRNRTCSIFIRQLQSTAMQCDSHEL